MDDNKKEKKDLNKKTNQDEEIEKAVEPNNVANENAVEPENEVNENASEDVDEVVVDLDEFVPAEFSEDSQIDF